MIYSAKEVAEKMGVSEYTLMFYGVKQLLPVTPRKENGKRVYNDEDVIILDTIECLKKTGTEMNDIIDYVDSYADGSSTAQQRFDLFAKKKEEVEADIARLQRALKTINYRYDFYKNAMENGYPHISDSDRENFAQKILDGKL